MAEKFEISPVAIEDMKRIYELSNDETVRKNSFNTQKIDWETHQKWFLEKLNNTDCIFYKMQSEKTLVAYIRLDKESDDWVLTIHVDKNFRNKGIGSEFLKEILFKNKGKRIFAYVKTENEASLKMFLNCNFKISEKIQTNGFMAYKLEKK